MNNNLRCVFSLSLFLFIAGCSVTNDQEHVENAKKYLAMGDQKSALIELKSALQQNPQNSTARIYLGKLYLTTANYAGAEKEFRKAQELGADDNDTSSGLSQALLQLRKIDQVLSIQTDGLTTQEKGKVLAAQGIAFLVQGETQKAIERSGHALSIAAEAAYVQVARASVYMLAEKSLPKAREQVNRAFAIDNNYAPAWSLLGDIEAAEKHLDSAREAYTRSLFLQPANLTDRNKRVSINIMLNDLEKAQKDLDILKKILPNNPGVAYSQGLVYLASDKLRDAKSAFDLALLDLDRHPMSLFYMAYVNYRQGDMTQAEINAERYFALNQNYLPNRKLLAEIKLEKKDYDYVETLLDPVVKAGNADDEAKNILAKTLLMRGKTAEGIALLKQIVEHNPESAEARFRLGASLMIGGDQAESIAQLETSIKQNIDKRQADIFRILSYLRLKEFKKAHQAAIEYQARSPESEVPYNMIAMVYLAERDYNAAQEALEQSWKVKPGNTDAGHNMAILAMQDKAYDKARFYLEGVMSVHPDNLGTLIKLAELDALEGKTEQQVQRLEKAIRLYPAAVKPRLLLSQHYLRTGNPDLVTGLIETLDNEAKKQPPVLEVIANQQLAQKDFNSAEKIATEIITSTPNAPQGYFILAQAYAGMGEGVGKVEEMLRRAIQQDEAYLPARIVLLRLLIKKQEIPAVEREIAALKLFAADNENVMKAEILLEELKGDKQKALRLAEKVFETFPNIGNMLVLSRQRLRKGDNTGALKLKIDWAESHSAAYYPNLVVAVTYTRLRQDALAVKYYERALAASPEAVVVLNNLAWSIRNTDPAKALSYAQKANRLKPGSVELMDTLAMVYLANEEPERALRTIKEALYLQPKNPMLHYHQAMIDATTGNRNQAVQVLTQLLDNTPDFSERVEAKALLEKLKND